MNKKTRAALAGLAFFAGCEIGIAIQLMKMIHKFTVRESAMDAPIMAATSGSQSGSTLITSRSSATSLRRQASCPLQLSHLQTHQAH